MADPHGEDDGRGVASEAGVDSSQGGLGSLVATEDQRTVSSSSFPEITEHGEGEGRLAVVDRSRSMEDAAGLAVELADGTQAYVSEHEEAAHLDVVEARPFQAHTTERPITVTGRISLILDSIQGARLLPSTFPDPKLKLRDQRKIHFLDSMSIKYTSFSKFNTKILPKFPLSIAARRTITISDNPFETRPNIQKRKRLTQPNPNTTPKNHHGQNDLYLPYPIPRMDSNDGT